MSENCTPIQLHEFSGVIKDVSDEQLQLLEKKINTSIEKLQESNQIMLALANGDTKGANGCLQSTDKSQLRETDDTFAQPTGKDSLLYMQTVKENRNVIINLKARLLVLNRELQRRGLIPAEESDEHAKQNSQEASSLEQSNQHKEEKNSIFL